MKKLYIFCGVMLCLIAACLVFLAVQPKLYPFDEDMEIQGELHWDPKEKLSKLTVPPTPTVSPNLSSVPEQVEDSETVEAELPYICPDELTAAIEKNPDVYAWLSIPGTNVEYPVLQSRTSDTLYLSRDAEGKYSAAGALMTEHTYNGTDFNDPVTVIYGHNMKSGAMFGNLQRYYADADGIESYQTIEVFLPDRKLEYEVFASVPYDKRHILYNYDFNDSRIFSSFFKSIVSIRSFNANVIRSEKPRYGDKVLILSTCLSGDSSRRYLVMAKIKTDII